MKSRRDILFAHYAGFAKKLGNWVALVSCLSLLFVSVPVNAGGAQITSRSTTLGSSVISASTTYALSFKLASSGITIHDAMIQLCTSPLETTTCTGPTGASLASATLSAQGGQFTGWTVGAGTPPAPTASAIYITNATGFSENTSTTQTLTFSSVTNPSAHNTEFYVRITTYTGATSGGGTGETDFGAMAVSTGDQVTVQANVQESLTLCVYLSTCVGGGGTLNIGCGADNTLASTTAAMCGSTSKIDVSTNASTGYVLTYISSNTGGTAYNCSGVAGASSGSLGSANDCIPDAGASAVGPPAAGVGMFGINLKANSTALTPGGAIGANASGGSGVAVAPYATADQIAFVAGATPQTIANSASAPSATTTFTVSYAAQASSSNKPGSYQTTFTYVATGTF